MLRFLWDAPRDIGLGRTSPHPVNLALGTSISAGAPRTAYFLTLILGPSKIVWPFVVLATLLAARWAWAIVARAQSPPSGEPVTAGAAQLIVAGSTMPVMADAPRRRWFRFRLSTILILTAIAAWIMTISPLDEYAFVSKPTPANWQGRWGHVGCGLSDVQRLGAENRSSSRIPSCGHCRRLGMKLTGRVAIGLDGIDGPRNRPSPRCCLGRPASAFRVAAKEATSIRGRIIILNIAVQTWSPSPCFAA